MKILLIYSCFLVSCLSRSYFVAGEERHRVKRSPEIYYQVPGQTNQQQSNRGNFFKAKLAVRSDLADDDTDSSDALRTNAISYDNKPTFLSLRRLAQPATSLVGFSQRNSTPSTTTTTTATVTSQRSQFSLNNKDLQLLDKVEDPSFSETQKINSSPFIPQVAAPSFAATQAPTAAVSEEPTATQELQTQEPFNFLKQQEGLIQPNNNFQFGGQLEGQQQQQQNLQQYILPQLDQEKLQGEGRSATINFVPAGLPQVSPVQGQTQQQPQFSFPQQSQQGRLPQQLGAFPLQQPQFLQQQPSSSGFTPNFPNVGSGRQDMGQQDPNQGVQFFNQPGQNQFQSQFPQAMQQDPFQQAQAGQQMQQQPQFQDPFQQQQQQQFQNPSQQFQGPIQQQASQFQPGQFAPQATQDQFNQVAPMSLGTQGTDPFATQQQQPPFGQPTSQAEIFNQASLPQSQFNQFLPPDQQNQQGPLQTGASFQDPSQVPFNPAVQPQGLPQLDGQNSQNFQQQAPPQFDGQNGQNFFPGQQQNPSIPPGAQQQEVPQGVAQGAPQGANPSSDGFFIPQQQANNAAQLTLPPPVGQTRSDDNQEKSSAESKAEAQQRAFQDPITGASPRDAYGASSQPGYAGGYAGPQGYAGGAGGYGGGTGAGGAYGGQGPQSYGRAPGRYSPFAGGAGGGTGFGYPSGGSPYPYGAYGGFGYGYRPYYLGYNYDLAPYGIPQPQDFALYGQNTLHPEKSYYQKGQDYAGATGGTGDGAYGKSDLNSPYSGGKPVADPAKS